MRKTGILHKTYANKAPFPSYKSKRIKSSLPGKLWHKISLRILEKPLNIGLIIFINDINCLHLRPSKRDTINAVITFGGGCCCLGTQSCKTIIQKYFTQAFLHYHNNIWMLWTRSDRCLVKLSRLIAQSHMTFSIYSVNVFHRSLCTFFLIG